jgi:hypothetical protein
MRRRPGPLARYLGVCAPAISLLIACVPAAGTAAVTHRAAASTAAARTASVRQTARLRDGGLTWRSMRLQPGARIQPSASRVQPSAAVRPSAPSLAAARSALRHLDIGQPAAGKEVVASQIRNLAQVQSTNWSGYADDNSGGNSYSQVSAQWNEPAVSCRADEQSLAAFWVGIDGFSDGTVEQDGTLAQCYLGSAFYYTWWEMYPSNDAQFIGMTVSPGDFITASVLKSGTNYTLTITDSTNPGNSFAVNETCTNCADSSAEWIAEAPTNATSGTLVQLSDFHQWAPISATANGGPITGFPDDEITMVNSWGAIEAWPTPIVGGGKFGVLWEPTSSPSPGRVPPPGHPTGSPVPVRTPPV